MSLFSLTGTRMLKLTNCCKKLLISQSLTSYHMLVARNTSLVAPSHKVSRRLCQYKWDTRQMAIGNKLVARQVREEEAAPG